MVVMMTTLERIKIVSNRIDNSLALQLNGVVNSSQVRCLTCHDFSHYDQFCPNNMAPMVLEDEPTVVYPFDEESDGEDESVDFLDSEFDDPMEESRGEIQNFINHEIENIHFDFLQFYDPFGCLFKYGPMNFCVTPEISYLIFFDIIGYFGCDKIDIEGAMKASQIFGYHRSSSNMIRGRIIFQGRGNDMII